MPISQAEINKRLENFQTLSRRQHLPLTPQKMAIFSLLAASDKHPDAPEIYHELKKQFPSLSLATVYKNLKQFASLGIIKELPLTGDTSRYDAKLEIHGHAVDIKTNHIYDLAIDPAWRWPEQIMGRKIKNIEVTYYF